MSSYKEIVTKAVIGKCKKKTTSSFEVECEHQPNTVLGCWVINHSFSGSNQSGKVNLSGSFDVNVWYSYEDDTKTAVSTKRLSYEDLIAVPLKSESKIDSHSEILVECLKQPTVMEVKPVENFVDVKIEKEMGVEVIGNATVKIAVEDDFDEYEEIFDTEDETELNINVDELDDNYLETSTK